jgi:hypothetical protein
MSGSSEQLPEVGSKDAMKSHLTVLDHLLTVFVATVSSKYRHKGMSLDFLIHLFSFTLEEMSNVNTKEICQVFNIAAYFIFRFLIYRCIIKL